MTWPRWLGATGGARLADFGSRAAAQTAARACSETLATAAELTDFQLGSRLSARAVEHALAEPVLSD